MQGSMPVLAAATESEVELDVGAPQDEAWRAMPMYVELSSFLTGAVITGGVSWSRMSSATSCESHAEDAPLANHVGLDFERIPRRAPAEVKEDARFQIPEGSRRITRTYRRREQRKKIKVQQLEMEARMAENRE